MGWLFDLEEEIDEDRDPVPLGKAVGGAIVEIGEAWLSTWGGGRFRDPDRSRLPYAEYRETSHWLATRQRARLRAGGICQRCYADGRPLEVHHLTYARLGREAESDLIVLCRQCHAAEHGVPA